MNNRRKNKRANNFKLTTDTKKKNGATKCAEAE